MKTLLSFLLSLCLGLSLLTGTAAAGRAVKLGFIQPDSSLVNANVLRQYYISYLDELSKQTDWNYQLVNIPAEQAFAKIFAGDIDLLLSVEYPSSLGLHNGIIYSSMDFGYDVEGLYTRPDDDRFNPQDLNSLQGARVGLIAARPLNAQFEQFQQNNSLNFAIQEFADQQAMLAALRDGTIDLVVDTATNALPEEQFLLAYTRIPVRVAAALPRQERLVEMEQAVHRLNTENPHFEPQLSQTLAENLDFQLVHYTPQESQYISQLPALRLVIYGEARPYIEYDASARKATGIYPDLIAELAKNSGLNFTYVHVPTYEDAVRILENGGADLMLDIFTGSQSQQAFYYTNPLTEVPYTFVSSFSQMPAASESARLLLSRPAPTLLSFMQQKFPHWQITPSQFFSADVVRQVHQDQSSFALILNTSLEIDRPLLLYPDLSIMPDDSINVPMSLVISAHQPRILQGILNKAITQINPEIRRHIAQKHIIATRPVFSLRHILTFYPLQTGLVCGLILLLLTAMAFQQHHKLAMQKARQLLQEKNEALTTTIRELKTAQQSKEFYKEKAETDALTGVLNKAAIEAAGARILATPPQQGCCHALLIIDLDHFKEANDTLGHQRGDDILRRFALCLSHIVRANDAVGRFGGDEFILVLKDLPQATVLAISMRIREAAYNLEPAAPDHPRLSASIGIALHPRHGRDYQELLHNADQALYQVKENGRDGWSIAQH